LREREAMVTDGEMRFHHFDFFIAVKNPENDPLGVDLESTSTLRST
jgi:hypothetical protein